MDEINQIKMDLREDFGNPFYDFCKEIVDPMAKRINSMKWRGFTLPEEYPEPVSWSEAFKINWVWGLCLTHEDEVRPILKECKELLA